MTMLNIQDARATSITVRVARAALVEALGLAAGIVKGKSTIPALQGVLMEADPETGLLRFTATDLDRWLVTTVPAECSGPMHLVLPAKQAFEVANRFPVGQQVVLSGPATRNDDVGSRLGVEAGRARATLLTIPVREFPDPPRDTGEPVVGLTAGQLAAALARVAPAVSDAESRPILNAVCLHGTPAAGLIAVATNGHILGRARVVAAEAMPAGLRKREVLLPPSAVETLSRAFAPETPVALRLSPERATISAAEPYERHLTTRLIEGPYPSYVQLIPKETQRAFEVERKVLADALRRVLIVANEAHMVAFAPSAGELRLTAWSADAGRIEDVVPVTYTTLGDPEEGWRIGFNGQYVLDVLGMVGAERVRFAMTGEERVAMVTDAEIPDGEAVATADVLALVMPLRIQD